MHKRSTRPDGEKGMIEYDIDCITASPFGGTPNGRQIVKLLRQWNGRDLITYGDTEGNRGLYYGASGIVVNREYNGKICQTILELVHEASHATWRKQHPLSQDKRESPEDATNNELFAQLNELVIYVWLRDTKKLCSPEAEMDLREQRQKDGTLRSVVETHEREQRGEN